MFDSSFPHIIRTIYFRRRELDFFLALGVVGAVVVAGPNPENILGAGAEAPGAEVDPKENEVGAAAPGAGVDPKLGVVVEVVVLPNKPDPDGAGVGAAGVGAEPKLKDDVVLLLPSPPPKADGAGAPNADGAGADVPGPGADPGASSVWRRYSSATCRSCAASSKSASSRTFGFFVSTRAYCNRICSICASKYFK